MERFSLSPIWSYSNEYFANIYFHAGICSMKTSTFHPGLHLQSRNIFELITDSVLRLHKAKQLEYCLFCHILNIASTRDIPPPARAGTREHMDDCTTVCDGFTNRDSAHTSKYNSIFMADRTLIRTQYNQGESRCSCGAAVQALPRY